MGTFAVPIQVGNLSGQRFIDFEATVDTGSTYTVVPGDALIALGVRPVERLTFQLADDTLVQYPVADALLRLDNRERVVPVVFGPPGVSPLLGATALEIFVLAADPVHQQLIPVSGLLKSATPRN